MVFSGLPNSVNLLCEGGKISQHGKTRELGLFTKNRLRRRCRNRLQIYQKPPQKEKKFCLLRKRREAIGLSCCKKVMKNRGNSFLPVKLVKHKEILWELPVPGRRILYGKGQIRLALWGALHFPLPLLAVKVQPSTCSSCGG